MIWKDPKERRRFLRFAVVGTIGAVVDFGTFNLLTSLGHFPPVVASVISFIAAVSSNFTWHRYWTYPDSRSKPVPQQMAQFALVSATGLAIRTPIFVAAERPWLAVLRRVPFALPLPLDVAGHNLALATAVGVVMLWNFFINRYWTYNDVDSAPRSAG